MPNDDKVIIANRSAMDIKYGGGRPTIDAAVQAMIAADAARNLSTRVVHVDDAGEMAPFGAPPVVSAKDEVGAKAAVDAIAAELDPDYIMLLDGPDVVPHISLDRIPGVDDRDAVVESDLPYASASAFSRSASAYLALTRVVGRLPMTAGHGDAGLFAQLIRDTSGWKPRPRSAFEKYFALSCDVWKGSTRLNLRSVFGDHAALHLAPDAAHPTIDRPIGALVHLINCHGARGDPRFYGEGAGGIPPAMESDRVLPHIRRGVVAGVECCYGAELYDHGLSGRQQPICMAYLLRGALGFVGSTTISYGPKDALAQADLIVQLFLAEVLSGASIGRAMLEARQKFIGRQRVVDTHNLKTLAQFLLLGDPSVVPVEAAPPLKEMVADLGDLAARARDAASRRKARRIATTAKGSSIGDAAAYVAGPAKLIDSVATRVASLAQIAGYKGKPKIFDVGGGAQFQMTMTKSAGPAPQIAVIADEVVGWKTGTGDPVPSYRVLILHIQGGGIVAKEEIVSR